MTIGYGAWRAAISIRLQLSLYGATRSPGDASINHRRRDCRNAPWDSQAPCHTETGIQRYFREGDNSSEAGGRRGFLAKQRLHHDKRTPTRHFQYAIGSPRAIFSEGRPPSVEKSFTIRPSHKDSFAYLTSTPIHKIRNRCWHLVRLFYFYVS